MSERQKELVNQANKLLLKNGYLTDGRPKKSFSKRQRFFEKRIISTPMGNGSR
jgi:hypothetical protein